MIAALRSQFVSRRTPVRHLFTAGYLTVDRQQARRCENASHCGRDGAVRRANAATWRHHVLALRFFQLLLNFGFFATNIFQMALEKR